ncbi:MAG TPA: putative protein YqeY [Hyphomicrobiaceae bacterium MAG_BT-2024]
MREQIVVATKAALKEGDKRRLLTLRLISAAIRDRDIASRFNNKGESTGKELAEPAEILQLLQKMVRQRHEAITTYREAGHNALAEQEAFEISIIQEFLPVEMSEDEIRRAVADAIKSESGTSLKDMGRILTSLKKKYSGKMDFLKAGAFIRQILSE